MDNGNFMINGSNIDVFMSEAIGALFFGLFFYYFYMRPIVRRVVM